MRRRDWQKGLEREREGRGEGEGESERGKVETGTAEIERRNEEWKEGRTIGRHREKERKENDFKIRKGGRIGGRRMLIYTNPGTEINTFVI